MSAIVRVSNPATLSPYQCSGSGIRSRVGLSPTRPQWAAGMRIEPMPSEAVAAGHSPAATAAALPPLEPPAVRSVFQGLRVRPNAGPSVSPMMASSGVLVLPITTAPAARSRFTSSLSLRAGSRYAAVPQPVTSPVTSSTSFTAIGTPRSGRSSPAARRASACPASARARSAITTLKALSSGSRRSMRARQSSTSSRDDTSPPRTSSACRTTPAKASSSGSMGAGTLDGRGAGCVSPAAARPTPPPARPPPRRGPRSPGPHRW